MPQTAITSQLLTDIYNAFDIRFRDGLQRGRLPAGIAQSMATYLVKFGEIATNVPSSTGIETHLWISQVPGFKKWLGARQASMLKVGGLRVENDDYEETVDVPRNSILDGTYGQWGGLIDALGAEGGDDAFWLDLMIDTLLSLSTVPWGDNQPFFSSTRLLGDDENSLINNVVDAPITQAAMLSAVTAMMGYRGDKGLQLNCLPVVVLCGVTSFWTAKTYLEMEVVQNPGGTGVITNVTRGIATPRFHPRLPPNAWYVLGAKASFRALSAQRRQEATNLIQRIRPDDPVVFDTKLFRYGTDLRGAGFGAFPFLIVRGSDGTAPGAPGAKRTDPNVAPTDDELQAQKDAAAAAARANAANAANAAKPKK